MLAYYDSFAGLVPCRIVTAWSKLGNGRFDWKNQVEIVITATRSVYERGQRHTLSISRVIPRTAVCNVRSRKCSASIAAYSWPAQFARS